MSASESNREKKKSTRKNLRPSKRKQQGLVEETTDKKFLLTKPKTKADKNLNFNKQIITEK